MATLGVASFVGSSVNRPLGSISVVCALATRWLRVLGAKCWSPNVGVVAILAETLLE